MIVIVLVMFFYLLFVNHILFCWFWNILKLKTPSCKSNTTTLYFHHNSCITSFIHSGRVYLLLTTTLIFFLLLLLFFPSARLRPYRKSPILLYGLYLSSIFFYIIQVARLWIVYLSDKDCGKAFRQALWELLPELL